MAEKREKTPLQSKIQNPKSKISTIAVHAGSEPEPATGAVVFPVFMSSTFVQDDVGKHRGYDYSRADNPTRERLERAVAALEGARHGLAFGSGMAAIDAVVHLLKTGDHLVICDDVYGGTRRYFVEMMRQWGLEFDFVDASDVRKVEAAFRPSTRMLWLESPTNPLMKLCDIAALSRVAKRRGALTVVDNTFATPVLQRPLALGASIVLHSTTKYLGGHSDVIGGAVALDDRALFGKIKYIQKSVGGVPGPLDAYLVHRGIKTLPLRMARHCENGMAVAEFLETHPAVGRVNYPGLKSHPQHELAKRQMSGFGGMLSFTVRGGGAAARRVVKATRLFVLAESLGGVESLIEVPALMTHAAIPEEEREARGITGGLIRVSVGIEDAADLVADLKRALERG